MKIAVLTSSRADYGIYKPLLLALKDDDFFKLTVIAFGTHLSPYHGLTKNQIENDGFTIDFEIESLLAGDSPNAVSSAMAITCLKFAEFWKNNYKFFDLVFCLGDRYEMFAAVSAGIPFNIKFAHIHGGETTLGAIDNIFRHAITIASTYHFCATHEYKKRITELIHNQENILVSGALSLDNLDKMKLLTIDEFKNMFDVNLLIPTILCTFHPETVSIGENAGYANIIADSLLDASKDYQIIITLPNADTENFAIRERFTKLPSQSNNRIKCIENLGTLGYFSCMHHCKMLVGNTSSGIIEAASFNKFVINIGNRQKGRLKGNNVFDSGINKDEILKNIFIIRDLDGGKISNPYYAGGAVNKIIDFLKSVAFKK